MLEELAATEGSVSDVQSLVVRLREGGGDAQANGADTTAEGIGGYKCAAGNSQHSEHQHAQPPPSVPEV